ncbi:helix-turn-helix transcriptional regulator [Streptomyces sp. NPDC005574]|uniref:helix-turn-helix domain-containing protein n=1 Tax=Streptomyces sp. NPDC005574 TaxID=3156891 RepID=UPI0033A02BFD
MITGVVSVIRVPSAPLPDWVITRRQAIGDHVRAAREAKQLSQERLGELVGLDRKTINRVEQGTHGTLIDHLLLIASALDVPLAELVR